jgi:type VI secretion system protein ImpH
VNAAVPAPRDGEVFDRPETGRDRARETPAEVFADIAARPYRFDLFQAMRRIEAAHPHLPRLGDARRPVDEPFRFVHDTALTFAPAAISALEQPEGRPPRMVQRVIGFLGPNGALPIHLTEYALDRKLHSGDATFTRFLDILLHRFGLFFYRAWARSQPTVNLDRADESPLIRHVGAWIGLGEQRARRRDALGDMPKLFFVGRLSRQVRDADGLAAWLTSHLGVAARVEQFCGHWMRLERSQRSRLMRLGQHGVGRGVVLGESVWDVQHKFRIEIGPLRWARFSELLPGRVAINQLRALVRQYVGFEFAWDLRLVLAGDDVPRWALGGRRDAQVGRLGRTAWIAGYGTRRGGGDARDLVMNVESIRIEPATGGSSTTGGFSHE